MNVDDGTKVLAHADPDKQESLQSEAEPDVMQNEQTWPTESEILAAEGNISISSSFWFQILLKSVISGHVSSFNLIGLTSGEVHTCTILYFKSFKCVFFVRSTRSGLGWERVPFSLILIFIYFAFFFNLSFCIATQETSVGCFRVPTDVDK